MHVVIVREDNSVTIDGETRAVDCSGMESIIRVVQWVDTSGWIEFVNNGSDPFRVNEPIEDLAPYQDLIDAWGEAAEETPHVHSPFPVVDEMEMRAITEFKSDYDREMFVSFLKTSGPETIKSHINQFNDLDNVKRYLIQLTLLVAAVIRK